MENNKETCIVVLPKFTNATTGRMITRMPLPQSNGGITKLLIPIKDGCMLFKDNFADLETKMVKEALEKKGYEISLQEASLLTIGQTLNYPDLNKK